MASLGAITSEPDRRAAQASAIAAAPSRDEAMAANLAAVQQHFCDEIRAWTAATTGARAIAGEYRVRESIIDLACLELWEGELVAAGYAVSHSDGLFIVSLAPP